MATISIFLKIFFQNINFILPVTLFLLSITWVGINIFIALTKEKKWYIILPAGAILGLFSFIIFLGTFSYFLKGRFGIAIIFTLYLFFGLYLYRRIGRLTGFKFNLTPKSILLAFIAYLFLGFTAFLVGANQYGGDVIAYWGFATSFANGNYPIYSPWQPDFLSIHHKGTYMFEGAVHALTDVDMQLIHTMYSYFVVVCGFFLLWGWVRKITKKDLLSIVPSLVAYFSFGGVFLPLPDFVRFLIKPEVEHITGRLPILLDAKNRLGGASNLPEFIYINHRAAAFAGVLLLLILIFTKFRINEKFKPVIIAALSVGIISSDEIYLPVILFAVLGWFVYELVKKGKYNKKSVFLSFLLGLISFLLFFFIVENAVRNSLLTPPQEEPRFHLVTSLQEMDARLGSFKGAILRQNDSSGYFWYLPDLRLILILIFLLAFFSKSSWAKISALSIIGAILGFFLIEHTYYSQNNARFLHVLYQFCGLILAFVLIIFMNNKSKIVRFSSTLALFLLIIPPVIFALIYLYPLAKRPDYPNLYGRLPLSQVLKWMRKNVPRERVIFVDGFLTAGLNHSPYTLQGIQNYGLLVPVSPANFRVHTPDFGVEAIDLIYTLNPEAIKKLKVDYLFVTNDQLQTLNSERKKDLENPNFFLEVYKDAEGKVFKVLPTYLTEGKNIKGGISDLSDRIHKDSNMYLDYPPRIDGALRAALLLVLKERGNIYAEWKSGAFNYIETKIIINKPSPDNNYDYLVLGPATNPVEICNCKRAIEVWRTTGLILYKPQ